MPRSAGDCRVECVSCAWLVELCRCLGWRMTEHGRRRRGPRRQFTYGPVRPILRAPATTWCLALLPVTWFAYDVLAFELFGASESAAGYGASDAAMGELVFATFTSWVVVGADSAALRRAGVR